MQNEYGCRLLGELSGQIGDELVKGILEADQTTEAGIAEQRNRVALLKQKLQGLNSEAALNLGSRHLFVVHGLDGLDEITGTGPTRIAEVKNGQVESYLFGPGDVGLPDADPEDYKGGEPEEKPGQSRESRANA